MLIHLCISDKNMFLLCFVYFVCLLDIISYVHSFLYETCRMQYQGKKNLQEFSSITETLVKLVVVEKILDQTFVAFNFQWQSWDVATSHDYPIQKSSIVKICRGRVRKIWKKSQRNLEKESVKLKERAKETWSKSQKIFRERVREIWSKS